MEQGKVDVDEIDFRILFTSCAFMCFYHEILKHIKSIQTFF
jgi:hypothetical protein